MSFVESTSCGSFFFLLTTATVFLSLQISRPLTDYDEATYAKVVVDTLHSGHVASLMLSGHPWLEKPPFFLWLMMGSMKIFGEHEFAFRLPAILLALLCVWLVYLITKKLTDDVLAAVIAALVFLFSPGFYYYAREARLDSGVLMAILAGLYVWLRAREQEKLLLWIFPLLAIGFMFKSVIALLFFFVVFIYSFFYERWLWLKSKYLWIGALPALTFLIPWHAYELIIYGWGFWDDYVGSQVIQRAFTVMTGEFSYGNYVTSTAADNPLWLWPLVAIIAIYIGALFLKNWRQRFSWKEIAAPLFTALVILLIFSVAKTHLSPYIMPMFPFLAMFVAVFYYHTSFHFKKGFYLALCIALLPILIGCCYFFIPKYSVPTSYTIDETAIAKMYRTQNAGGGPLYAIGWQNLETLNYYSGTIALYVASTDVGRTIRAPFYAIMPRSDVALLFSMDGRGNLHSRYPGQQLLYVGQTSILIHADYDFVIP